MSGLRSGVRCATEPDGARLRGSPCEALKISQALGMKSEDNALEMSGKVCRNACAGNRQDHNSEVQLSHAVS